MVGLVIEILAYIGFKVNFPVFKGFKNNIDTIQQFILISFVPAGL